MGKREGKHNEDSRVVRHAEREAQKKEGERETRKKRKASQTRWNKHSKDPFELLLVSEGASCQRTSCRKV